MTAAVSAPVRLVAEPGGEVASRPAHAFKVETPAFFEIPEIIELFRRAFHGEHGERYEQFGVDAEEMRIYLRDNILASGFHGLATWLQFWVVLHDGEFCGFIIGSYSPWPQCPNCCLLHIHVDKAGVRDKLVTKAFGWAYGNGLTTISICNGSGKIDKVYQRWFRKYGRAKVVGSVMRIDLTEGPDGKRPI